MKYRVICRLDRESDDEKGRYAFATSKVFESRASAMAYLKTLHPAREPILLRAEPFDPESELDAVNRYETEFNLRRVQ